MSMTISELRDILDDMCEDGHGDLPIVAGYQPSYPLTAHVRGVVRPEEAVVEREEDFDGDEKRVEREPEYAVLVLTEGHAEDVTGSPYGLNWWWEVCEG